MYTYFTVPILPARSDESLWCSRAVPKIVSGLIKVLNSHQFIDQLASESRDGNPMYTLSFPRSANIEVFKIDGLIPHVSAEASEMIHRCIYENQSGECKFPQDEDEISQMQLVTMSSSSDSDFISEDDYY